MEPKKALLLFSFALILSLSLGIEDFNDHEWNYFVYSQWWPQTQCYYKHIDTLTGDQLRYNDYGFRNDCVPVGVEAWTIHGLWPTVNGTPHPGFCNHSWPFDISEIKDLKPKMMKQWLSLPGATEAESEELWSHEWEKHGTCAVSLPALSSEHNYFYKVLTLNLQYDLLKMLDKESVKPSDDKTYQIEDIENAITKGYGVKGRVICLDGPGGDQYLSGIRICMDKTFKLIDCLVTEPEKCRTSEPLKYPVIIHQSQVLF